MNKNQFLNFFSVYGWPFLRFFVKCSVRCKSCILSEKYTEISGGLCRECRALYENGSHSIEVEQIFDDEKEKLLYKILQSKNSNMKFDALLMLSGGKDSAYILDRIKKEFPHLRILCLFINNGFSSSFAIKNVLHITNQLKVDLMISNDFVQDFFETFRNAFVQLNGRGSSGVVDKSDGDKIFEIGKEIAKQMNIPFVIGGLSWTQVRQILKVNHFMVESAGSPTLIFPLAVWQTKENEIRSYVRKHNLVLKGTDSPIVSNNDLIVAMCAIDVLNNGYCSFEPEFAQMIREKKANRKEWLYNFEMLEFATLKGFLRRDIESTLARLGLTLNDVVKYSN